MPVYRISELYDLTKTIAAPLFENDKYAWGVLGRINDFILRLGSTLPGERFYSPCEGVWVAKSAKIAPSAHIGAPCVIDEDADVRHCAYIRGSAIIGKRAVVGNSTEVKNSILFDDAQAPHFNYVGDSILGHKAHFGAGVVASNLKSDRSPVVVKTEDEEIETGLKKMGCMAGDFAEVGCNSVLAPGCILGRHSVVYPVSFVRGQLGQGCIYKKQGEVVELNGPA